MLTFTSVARDWPFWLEVGRCRVRIFCFSVVEKRGGPDPLDPPSGSAPARYGGGCFMFMACSIGAYYEKTSVVSFL